MIAKHNKVVAIGQARLGSTRLPGKVLLSLGGMTLLELFVRRLRRARLLDGIVIATSTETRDELIVAECARIGVDCFRGDEQDVLDRYYRCALHHGATDVVRVTSDCPLIDAELIDEGVRAHCGAEADYTVNNATHTFPHGLDYQIISRALLERAAAGATEPDEREHVVPFIEKRIAELKYISLANTRTESCGDLRITIDNLDDFVRLASLLAAWNRPVEELALPDLVKLLRRIA